MSNSLIPAHLTVVPKPLAWLLPDISMTTASEAECNRWRAAGYAVIALAPPEHLSWVCPEQRLTTTSRAERDRWISSGLTAVDVVPIPTPSIPGLGGREIDLSKGVDQQHPDIQTTGQHLCLIDKEWLLGTFHKEWFGLTFSGGHYASLQFDTPGTNSSRWQRVIALSLPTS